MSAVTLIQSMALDGLRVSVTPDRNIKVAGGREAITRWLPFLTTQKTQIICALSEPPPDIQDFWDAVEERAAIMQHDAPDIYPTSQAAWEAAYLDTKSKWGMA